MFDEDDLVSGMSGVAGASTHLGALLFLINQSVPTWLMFQVECKRYADCSSQGEIDMKFSVLLSTFILTLCFSVSSLADKPKWAGEGGQPTAQEKEQHKEAMTSKHENKSKEKKKEKKKKKKKDMSGDRQKESD